MKTVRVVVAACTVIACFVPAVSAQPPVAKPGPEHERLKKMEGTWEASIKTPGGESKGTATYKMDLGGFWLLSNFKADFGGQPFEGRGADGYDPMKKKYVGTWIDGMMPHLFVMEGDADAAGKVFTLIGEGFDPATGKPAKEKWVTEIKDADTHTMTFYGPGADGKERKTGELTYTKQKKK